MRAPPVEMRQRTDHPGNVDRLGLQFMLAFDGDVAGPAVVQDRELCAERRQHAFGVIAGGDGFDHGGASRRVEAR